MIEALVHHHRTIIIVKVIMYFPHMPVFGLYMEAFGLFKISVFFAVLTEFT